jgi:glutamate/tyrosine decarboxylase-like PLP-dependent enzyme
LTTVTDPELLHDAAARAARYLAQLSARSVVPTSHALTGLSRFDTALPERPIAPEAVLAQLDELGSPATIASAGPRYFGFVTGGALPVTVAAGWLATAWDQNAGLAVQSPIATRLEEVVLRWVLDVFGLPSTGAGGFVTGATMANFSCLAAARHALCERQHWDVEARGLIGAPPIQIVAGDEVHVSVLKALMLVGLGRETIRRVPVDGQGRLRVDQIGPLDDRTILCLQVGNVNSGAFDAVGEACARANEAGAWVHVDGAFGLWAAAAPRRAHLVAGIERADSWAVDAHKWLNVPYDSGIALCRHPAALRGAMSTTAPYLVAGTSREPCQYVPDFSRRARGVELWAALASLGRSGMADLIERCCQLATQFADGLRAAGYEVPNEVVLNQVLVHFGDDQRTRDVIARVQQDGTCWCGGTIWKGRAAMRISVSSWATTEEDVAQSLAAILRVANHS